MEVIVKENKSEAENQTDDKSILSEKTKEERCGENRTCEQCVRDVGLNESGSLSKNIDKESSVYNENEPVFPPSSDMRSNGMSSYKANEAGGATFEPIFKDEPPKNGVSQNVCGKGAIFAKDSPVDKASVIFGQSEDEMRREFRAFKAAKLFKKFDCDLTEIYSPEMLDQKLLEAKNFGFGAVVVTPQKIKIAKERLKGSGTEVVAAVCFPFGEECAGVKKYAVKKAIANGADRIYVPVGISVIKFGAIERIRREFKSIVKSAKKKKVSAVLESGMLTAQEAERAVRVLNGVKVMSFVSASGGMSMSEGVSAVKNIRYFLRSGSEVCGFTASRKSDEAVGLMSVADRLFVKNAAELAADIRANLKY